ncbi:MAG: hypothetical protein FWG64_09305 [Firmicutes bacterium]|nr:hypothetical protein [Bacillota bacterium]
MEDNKIFEEEDYDFLTKEEFARKLTRALRQFAPIMLGHEKPKNNIHEKIAEWIKMAEELED